MARAGAPRAGWGSPAAADRKAPISQGGGGVAPKALACSTHHIEQGQVDQPLAEEDGKYCCCSPAWHTSRDEDGCAAGWALCSPVWQGAGGTAGRAPITAPLLGFFSNCRAPCHWLSWPGSSQQAVGKGQDSLSAPCQLRQPGGRQSLCPHWSAPPAAAWRHCLCVLRDTRSSRRACSAVQEGACEGRSSRTWPH